MSNKTKRIAKGLGASALAVATIASGLSFGTVSASAATASTQATGKSFQLVSRVSANSYTALVENGAGVDAVQSFGTLAAAQAAAVTLTAVPLPDGFFAIRTPSGGCAASWNVGEGYLGFDLLPKTTSSDCSTLEGAASQFYWWTQNAQGNIVGASSPQRTWVVTPTVQGGKYRMQIGGSGQFVGIPADLGATHAALTAAGVFPADVSRPAVIAGSSEPNTRIEVRENGGKLVASTTSDADGDWTIDFPAPDIRGSLYTVHVNQVIDGDANGNVQVDLNYGARVSITTPTDQASSPAGATTISGAGEPGSQVRVRNNGGTTPVLSTTVAANGTWTGSANLTAGEHVLEATQLSKGARTTTATVTVNPGEANVEFTAAGRFDADDATRPAVAHGSAPAGSTVILRNSVGTEIGRATAGDDDTWQIAIDPARATSGVNSFSAIVQGDAGNAKSFTLDYGTVAPTVVTTPALNSTVAPGTVRFAGTGQPGSKIVVRGSVRQVATATVNAQGAWSAESTVQLPKGSYNLYFDQTSKGGLKGTIQHRFFLGETAPVVTPPTVTSPGSGDVLDTLTPEFRGTGYEGATITVRGSSRVIATGTVMNGRWVATTSAAAPLAPGSYNLYVDQSIRGTVTSTIRIAFTVSNEAFRELTLSAPAQNENVMVLRPTFVGTATPGAEIRVGSSRTTVATATVAADGTWRATPDFDLARGGTYRGLEVKQTLKSGKTSTVSATFTVDRKAQ
ncbi:Ig-like domain-containing protein [Curtobacterium luteum]|uniref:Ig-like domain-containing protein n=1 Tax=Curtobacterium luteum TaxID=33881 RepID=UPI00382CA73C